MRWLGFDWGEHLYHASDYFEQLYDWAEHLIRAGKAYVDDQTQEEMRLTRGTLTEAGTEQPVTATAASRKTSTCSAACAPASFRTARACCAPRSTWRRATSICATRCSTASCTPSIRAPATTWCIYPSYDFAHGQSDAIEGITHSICTLEFEDHRPLYDWFLDEPAGAVASASVRVRAAQSHLHGAVEARAHRAGARRPRRAAGTIRACRRLPACAGAACRRRRSAISSNASASPRPTASSTWRCSSFPSASISTRPRSGAWRCCGR